jgi:protein tyrosine phosphatase
MTWIQNISLSNAINGIHYFVPHKTVLIRIQDFGNTVFQPVLFEVHKFCFNDNDDPNDTSNITIEQANQIANILKNCKDKGYNIVVHCIAGLCRSGAIADVGILYGFEDTETKKIPNMLVKNRLKECFNMKVDYTEVFKFVLPDWE